MCPIPGYASMSSIASRLALRRLPHLRWSQFPGMLVFAALPVICLGGLLAACGESAQAPAQKAGASAAKSAASGAPGGPQAVPARVLEVVSGRVPIVFEAIGQIEGSKEVEIRSRVSGILQKRIYNEGELVTAGARLFQIDPTSYEIALAQARAQLAQERARNEQARRESGRLRQLAEQRAISQREFDDSTSTLKLSDAGIEVAEARVREAELNLSYTLVTAPVAGISGRAVRSEGSLITTGPDSLLTTITQISPIWVRFSLSDADLAKLPDQRLGGATEVRLLLPNGNRHEGKGRINYAATQIDPRIGTRQLRAEFDNAGQRLLPGQFVRVQITAGQRDNVFLVPQTAVLQTEKGYFVFALDQDGKAALRPVRTGEWIGRDWSILEGLKAGDRVVIDNLQKLQPGMTVKPLDAAAANGQAGSSPTGGSPAGPATGAPAKAPK